MNKVLLILLLTSCTINNNNSEPKYHISPEFNKRLNKMEEFSTFYKTHLLRQLSQRETKIVNGVLAKFPTDLAHIAIVDCAWQALKYDIANSACDPMADNFSKCYEEFNQVQTFQCSIKQALNYCGRLYSAVGYYADEVETGVLGCKNDK